MSMHDLRSCRKPKAGEMQTVFNHTCLVSEVDVELSLVNLHRQS